MTAMDKLEALRLSAKACEHEVRWLPYLEMFLIIGSGNNENEWNPSENADQRWECVKRLLEMGYIVTFNGNADRKNECWNPASPTEAFVDIECPAEEFPHLALAELERRKDDQIS